MVSVEHVAALEPHWCCAGALVVAVELDLSHQVHDARLCGWGVAGLAWLAVQVPAQDVLSNLFVVAGQEGRSVFVHAHVCVGGGG